MSVLIYDSLLNNVVLRIFLSHPVICAEHKKKTEKHVWLFQFSESCQASEGAKDDLSNLEEDQLRDILLEKVTTSLVLSIPTFHFIRGLCVQMGFRNWHLEEAPFAWTCAWGFQMDGPVNVYSVELFSLIVFHLPPLTAMREINLHMGQKVSCQNEKKRKLGTSAM